MTQPPTANNHSLDRERFDKAWASISAEAEQRDATEFPQPPKKIAMTSTDRGSRALDPPDYKPAAVRSRAVMALPSALPPESFMAAPTKKPAILGSPSLRR